MGGKGERTKEQICKEAFLLFAEHGYTGVSMQDICIKCGLSKGGLYRHYESKKQLLLDLLERMQREEGGQTALFCQRGDPAPSVLDAFLEHTRRELDPRQPRINLAIYEFCSEYKEEVGKSFLEAQYQRGRELLLQLFRYGVERREFEVEHPQAAADSMLLLFEGMKMINEVMELSDEQISGVFHQVRRMLGVYEQR